MVQDELTFDEEQGGGLSTGAIIGTAVAAGIVAFMIRRARQRQHRMDTAAEVAAAAWERASDADLRTRTAAATRDFVVERLLPEMKPVLLDLLRDVEGYVSDLFRRLEKAIRDM